MAPVDLDQADGAQLVEMVRQRRLADVEQRHQLALAQRLGVYYSAPDRASDDLIGWLT